MATDPEHAMDSSDDGVWLDAPVAAELVGNCELAQMWDTETAKRRATTPTPVGSSRPRWSLTRIST
jgi:hypothetical protein